MKFQDIKIAHMSDWIAVSHIPTKTQDKYRIMNDQHGTCGVYQVAQSEHIEEIGDAIVHPKIGYTGKSANVLNRTYAIRQPAGDHGANRYIRQNGFDKSVDVVIRYIYCHENDLTNLESTIHKTTSEKYGYRFAWVEASAGNDGNKSTIVDLAERLTSEEILDIIKQLKNIAIENNEREFLKRLDNV